MPPLASAVLSPTDVLPQALPTPECRPETRSHAGSPAFKRTTRAMFIGGFATFSMLYGIQPLLPMLSAHFHLSPSAASSALSLSTMGMALMLIPASFLADRWGRTPLMKAVLIIAALLMLLSACVSEFNQLLVIRTLFGLVLAGLPAVAMTYQAEEIEPAALGRALGLYISGNALGGMSGRLMAALITDWANWQTAFLFLGGLGLLAGIEFWRALPPSRHFQTQSTSPRQMWRDAVGHWKDPGLAALFSLGFMLMGVFVSVYNYLGYRLLAAPFSVSHSFLGWICSLYVVGMIASNHAGRLADRYGRRDVLWPMVAIMLVGLLLTLTPSLWGVIPGLALLTFGFFAAHSVASSWVGRRVRHARALASAFYLFSYYVGASILGSGSGLVWDAGGWNAVVAVLALLLLLCLGISLYLRRLPPLAP